MMSFRGGGMKWNWKIFNLFMPFLFPLYIISIFFYLILSVQDMIIYSYYSNFINFLFFFFVSILPVLIHELTKGLKVGKAYYAVHISFLFFLFCFLGNLQNFKNLNNTYFFEFDYLFLAITLICFIQSIHSYFMVKENIQTRIGVKKLYEYLVANKITEFCTYQNKFNKLFVENMLKFYPNNFKVNYIKTLDDINLFDNKIVIVPPITSKVFVFNTDYEVALEGFFSKDKKLLKILNDESIQKISLTKIKTMCSYKYYIYDDEVLSYRSIYLNQINDKDFYYGLGWIIDLKNINIDDL